METFFSLLERRVQDCSSLLCVGLDPHPSDLASPDADGALAFCMRVIRATARYAAAFKPNAAFFEALGPAGWQALHDTVTAIRAESDRLGSHIPVILDAKRGDIASTAEAYARSAFEALGVDAITLSPYLGKDSIDPFLTDPEKGIFLLCKTSNPGASELQDLPVMGTIHPEPLHIAVARLAQRWNTRGNVGLVVGATHPEALARVRAASPDLWILAPGIGAQGGDLEAALQAGLRADGLGLLLAVSRSIAQADDPSRAAAALRDQTVNLQPTLTSGRRPGPPKAADRDLRLADALLDAGCVVFGEFTLKSGIPSPIYFDLRRLISFPGLLAEVADAYLPLLRTLRFDRLAALPYAAIPIATAISLRAGYPMVYPRKEAKAYGTRAEIEGEHRAGETVVMIDDLATTGGSKLETVDRLSAAGLQVTDVVVLIDRQGGASQALEDAGLRLHAVLTLSRLLDGWEARRRVPAGQIAAVRSLLARNG
jgi:uridine monophosphate synthetase